MALGGLPPLQRAGYRVIGLDVDSTLSPGSHLVDEFRTAPRALERQGLEAGRFCATANDAYLDFMRDILSTFRPVALLINPDPEVLAIASWAESGPWLMPSFKQVLAAHDKQETQRILADADVPLPRWIETDSDEAFERDCRLVLGQDLRILAKERASAAGKHLRVADSLEEARRMRAAHPEMIYSEFLPGREFAVFLVYRDGELFLEGGFEKHLYNWGQGLRNVSFHDTATFDLARRAVGALAAAFGERPNGTYHVDLRQNSAGSPRVLEINAGRAFGGTPDSYICFAGGINLPALYVDLVMGRTPARQRLRAGIAQLQLHNYVFVEREAITTWVDLFRTP